MGAEQAWMLAPPLFSACDLPDLCASYFISMHFLTSSLFRAIT